MQKLTKFERFQIAATMVSGSEFFHNKPIPQKVLYLLVLAKELENRQDEEVQPEEKQVSITDIL